MHNLPALMKGYGCCTLQISQQDATRIGLTDGSSARITSRVRSMVAPVEVTEDLRPGVVSLPHGWGHDVEESRLTKVHAGVHPTTFSLMIRRTTRRAEPPSCSALPSPSSR